MAAEERGARAGWAYLVGAGPGDPGLLTLRGAELLRTADVVLHDELVAPALLALVGEDTEVRAVGKRGAKPQDKRAKQAAINRELVALAQRGSAVVRLKGGDPFVFGRGAEELAALRQAAVPFEVVPGISAPVGATAYAGIPLTDRDRASSVTFVTAVRRDGSPFDWGSLSGIDGTLCVFMRARNVTGIARGTRLAVEETFRIRPRPRPWSRTFRPPHSARSAGSWPTSASARPTPRSRRRRCSSSVRSWQCAKS